MICHDLCTCQWQVGDFRRTVYLVSRNHGILARTPLLTHDVNIGVAQTIVGNSNLCRRQKKVKAAFRKSPHALRVTKSAGYIHSSTRKSFVPMSPACKGSGSYSHRSSLPFLSLAAKHCTFACGAILVVFMRCKEHWMDANQLLVCSGSPWVRTSASLVSDESLWLI